MLNFFEDGTGKTSTKMIDRPLSEVILDHVDPYTWGSMEGYVGTTADDPVYDNFKEKIVFIDARMFPWDDVPLESNAPQHFRENMQTLISELAEEYDAMGFNYEAYAFGFGSLSEAMRYGLHKFMSIMAGIILVPLLKKDMIPLDSHVRSMDSLRSCFGPSPICNKVYLFEADFLLQFADLEFNGLVDQIRVAPLSPNAIFLQGVDTIDSSFPEEKAQ